MANSRFYQFLYSKDAMLTRISANFVAGGAGVINSSGGKGVLDIHRRTTGLYYIELLENYNQLVGFDFWIQSGWTTPVSMGNLVVGSPYKIDTLGNTSNVAWGNAGFYFEDFTAAPGMVFVATTTGTGTGGTKALVSSGIANIELLPAQAMLQNSTPGEGSLFVAGLYDYAGALADPGANSVITMDFYLRNSTIAY